VLKRRYNPHASIPEIDEIYETALDNGALGGRLLGAGSGGYFLFFAEPFQRYRLTEALAARGLKTREVVFDKSGLQSWSVRAD